jgi:hypothetical protein
MADWPEAADLIAWLGDANLSSDSEAKFPEVLEAVTEQIVDMLDPDLLPDDDSCPPSIRQAILIEAARIWTRSAAANGVIAVGDMAMRVNRFDPDVSRLIYKYRPYPEP